MSVRDAAPRICPFEIQPSNEWRERTWHYAVCKKCRRRLPQRGPTPFGRGPKCEGCGKPMKMESLRG